MLLWTDTSWFISMVSRNSTIFIVAMAMGLLPTPERLLREQNNTGAQSSTRAEWLGLIDATQILLPSAMQKAIKQSGLNFVKV